MIGATVAMSGVGITCCVLIGVIIGYVLGAFLSTINTHILPSDLNQIAQIILEAIPETEEELENSEMPQIVVTKPFTALNNTNTSITMRKVEVKDELVDENNEENFDDK